VSAFARKGMAKFDESAEKKDTVKAQMAVAQDTGCRRVEKKHDCATR